MNVYKMRLLYYFVESSYYRIWEEVSYSSLLGRLIDHFMKRFHVRPRWVVVSTYIKIGLLYVLVESSYQRIWELLHIGTSCRPVYEEVSYTSLVDRSMNVYKMRLLYYFVESSYYRIWEEVSYSSLLGRLIDHFMKRFHVRPGWVVVSTSSCRRL